LEHKGKVIFDIPFMTQSHAESMKKNPGSPLANKHSQSSPGFFHTFSMALYHIWDVKNGIAFVLQFFSLISDSLGGVECLILRNGHSLE
jgi:hypothetical protein